MTKIEFETFKVLIQKSITEVPPELRYGQYVFNTLYKLFPDIANQIRGTNLDPFYNDDSVYNLLNYINHFHVKD